MALNQGWATSVLEGHCPTEFSFNPNQTHQNKLIKAFRITRKLQAGDFFSGLELNSVEQWPSRTKVAHPCSKQYQIRVLQLVTITEPFV